MCLLGATRKECGAAESILITFRCDTCDPHDILCALGGAGVGASQGVCKGRAVNQGSRCCRGVSASVEEGGGGRGKVCEGTHVKGCSDKE